jgi:hypothetical protein
MGTSRLTRASCECGSERRHADAIKANITKGVFKVTVPKPAPAQVKKIEVKPLPSFRGGKKARRRSEMGRAFSSLSFDLA